MTSVEDNQTSAVRCVIIGASHAGVNLAFSLRKEGYKGKIDVIDSDPTLPYHRPPLSKAYLTSDDNIEKNQLKSAESYEKSAIDLHLGCHVSNVDTTNRCITFVNQNEGNTKHTFDFDTLVFATGARPFIPPIKGIDEAKQLFPLRTAKDVADIKQAMTGYDNPKVVIIGGGYIGLETAASMKKLGANVTVLEREARLLARVTSPYMSDFFAQLHKDNGVAIHCNKNVQSIRPHSASAGSILNTVTCEDGDSFDADIIIVGVGIRVNTELASDAGLKIENGVVVNQYGESSIPNVYAIGDCSFHHNIHYDRFIRLESVQNAVDQAKTAARSISYKYLTEHSKPLEPYNAIPWFWSDQYQLKLQMVGLAQGYDDIVIRIELSNEDQSQAAGQKVYKFSVWYFKGQELLAVDAVNNAKAYVIGTKVIKNNLSLDKANLQDPEQSIL